jgi:hypothetical protein
MYIYESHMGGLYSSDFELNRDHLYCEECGDSDFEMGQASTFTEGWKLIAGSLAGISIDDSGGYALDYVYNFLCENFYPEKETKAVSEKEIIEDIIKIFKSEGVEDPEKLIDMCRYDEDF